MAKAKAAPAAKPGTAVVDWKDELKKEAQVAKGMESSVGASNFFSLKGGKLSYNDSNLPNNEMAVIVVDYVLENTYYDEAYDPDSPASPVCFAFGRDEDTMAPHEESTQPQSENCKSCPHNKFGSAERGRGKACRNSRRMALTPAGKISKDGELMPETDPDYFLTSDIAMLKVPPTSLKGWAQYVREVAGYYEGPPAVVYTHVKVVEDDADQFHVNFAHAGKISDEVLQAIMAKRKGVREIGMLEQPYKAIEADDQPKKKGKSAPARGRGRGKY